MTEAKSSADAVSKQSPKSKQTRSRAEKVVPKSREIWVLGLFLSLFHRRVWRRGRWETAPPIEFGENRRWEEVYKIGHTHIGKGRPLDKNRLGSYANTLRLTRNASDGMWKNRLGPNAIVCAGWKGDGSELGREVREELWELPRHEIAKRIWNFMDENERSKYPNVKAPVDERAYPDPRKKVWDEEKNVPSLTECLDERQQQELETFAEELSQTAPEIPNALTWVRKMTPLLFRTSTLAEVVRVGKLLNKAKEVLPRGKFWRWLDIVGIEERTARNYRWAAKYFGEDYDIHDRIKPRAAYRLAGEKEWQKAAAKDARELARGGVIINHTVAENLLKNRRPNTDDGHGRSPVGVIVNSAPEKEPEKEESQLSSALEALLALRYGLMALRSVL